MTVLPPSPFAASVTIVDLPIGTTVTGAEIFEAVQTSSGIGASVQLTLNQLLAISGNSLPVMTVPQYWADTPSKLLTTDTTWGAAGSVTLTDAATVTMDFSTFINAKLTGTVAVGSSRTLAAATNAKVGQSGQIEWYPVTSALTLVIPSGSTYVAAGGVSTLSLSASNGARDVIVYTVLNDDEVLLAVQKAVAT